MKTMRGKLVLCIALAVNCALSAQGVPPDSSRTFAIVVGIADYQHDDIPDIPFADQDAVAFANYLTAPQGGNVRPEDVRLLVNRQATHGAVALALDWMLETSKPGDRAILYFNGHLDVEVKRVNQPGFLLCWDAPQRFYLVGGTMPLQFLDVITQTLSDQQVKPIFFFDVRHSDQLGGSAIGGPELAAKNLLKSGSTEIKILSCQPKETSLKGVQWAGGHRVFTYHLIHGLAGAADRDGDRAVTLAEIGDYLEDMVSADAAPHAQHPVRIGDRSTVLSRVYENVDSDVFFKPDDQGGSVAPK